MSQSGAGSLVKILGIFNFLSLVIGLFLAYLGYRIFDFQNVNEDLNQIIQTNLSTCAFILMGFGGSLVLISLVGFIALCCESSLALNVYSCLLLIILLTHCVGLYFNYQIQKDVTQQLESGTRAAINSAFYDRPNPRLAYTLQVLQNKLKCCGWTGPSDYRRDILQLPASCCGEPVKLVDPMERCSRLFIKYTDGCRDSVILKFLKDGINFASYALIFIVLILILTSWCLVRELNHYQRVRTRK